MIIFNANYRFAQGAGTVDYASPLDAKTPTEAWWYDRISALAPRLASLGVTHVLLPPACKGASLGAGYDLYDNYDIGDKKAPNGSVPTRAGTADQARRCVAICHANGLKVLTDFVIHQYDGGPGGTYQYPASGGKTAGRFPKHPSCFVGAPPRVEVDPVWNSEGDFGFGDQVAVVNSTPKNYMWDGIASAMSWMTQTLGIDGYRMDDVKGMYAPFVHALLTQKAMADKWAFAEDFEGAEQQLENWVNSPWSGMQGRCSALDFTTHWHLQDVLDNGYPMSHIVGQGLLWADATHAVTFVDSPDTDTSPGEAIINSKLLAYAIILAATGVPQIYYRDYSSDPNCYGLHPEIDNLTWISSNMAVGPMIAESPNENVIIIQREWWPGLLMAVNKDTWNARTVTVQTSFGPNTHLHDYSGHHGDIWTDSEGRATFRIPSNANSAGRSYLAFSVAGITGKPVPPPAIWTTQTFEGADDMIIPTVASGAFIDCGRIWIATGHAIKTAVNSDLMAVGIVDATGVEVGGPDGVPSDGWYTVRVQRGADGGTPLPFVATVTYLAPADAELVA